MEAQDEAREKRSWKCPGCGRKNQLFQFRCLDCGERFTEEVARKQGLRTIEEGLPEEARREFEAAKKNEERRAELHRRHLNSRRWQDLGIGTGLFLVLFLPLTCLTPFYLLFAPFTGAAAGLALNRVGGGNFEGMVLFGASYVVTLVAGSLLGGIDPLNLIFFFFCVGGLALSTTMGYLKGMSMSLVKFDEGI